MTLINFLILYAYMYNRCVVHVVVFVINSHVIKSFFSYTFLYLCTYIRNTYSIVNYTVYKQTHKNLSHQDDYDYMSLFLLSCSDDVCPSIHPFHIYTIDGTKCVYIVDPFRQIDVKKHRKKLWFTIVTHSCFWCIFGSVAVDRRSAVS